MLKKIMAAAAALMMIGGAPALAQKVAYYDHGEVITQSKAWKAVKAELETKSAEINTQLQPLVSEVQTEKNALQQVIGDKTIEQLSDSEKKRVTELDQKLKTLVASEQRVQQQFGIVSELAESKINATIKASLEDVAKSKRVDVLQRSDNLGYVSSKHDATAEMIAAVDRRLATLSVDALIQEASARQQAAQQQAQAAAN